MKTLVLGYEKADGTGPAIILAGPEASRNEAWEIVMKGKRQEFPKGINRIEFYVLEQREMAIRIVKAPEPTTTKSKSK